MDTTDYTITEPELLQANINSVDISDVLCYGESTGQVIVTVSGGSINVNNQYSYSWIPNVGNPRVIMTSIQVLERNTCLI